MLGKDLDAITKLDRQTGKIGDSAAGFGGSVGAWRRHDAQRPRSDAAIKADIEKWRRAHPRGGEVLARSRALHSHRHQDRAIGLSSARRRVPPSRRSFEAGKSVSHAAEGRSITYPEARLVPSKFEGYPPDVMFKDNARRQWKETRAWHGTFTENVVQGTARDILVATIARMEAHGLPVVLHVHDDLVVEAPIGTVTPEEFQRLALEPVPWADGLPLAGKARVAHCYLEEPEEPLQPQPDSETAIVETALDSYLDDARAIVVTAASADEEATGDEGEDDDAFLDDLDPNSAPLRDFVSLPLTDDNKVSCPFHEDPTPSLQIYPDHWHCFGCGEHGDRIDWLVRVEGMNRAEALAAIQDWEPPARCAVTTVGRIQGRQDRGSDDAVACRELAARQHGRALPERDPWHRRQQATGRYPREPAIPSALPVRLRHRALHSRADARSFERRAGRHSSHRAARRSTARSPSSIARRWDRWAW